LVVVCLEEKSRVPFLPLALRLQAGRVSAHEHAACSFDWWLMLIYSERKVLLVGCW
jgi:hypothetical protein